MKAKFFALLAVVLAVVSCQRDADDLNVAMGGEQEVMLTVSLPEATRANSAQGFDISNIASTEYTLRYILEIYRVKEGTVLYDNCQRFVETSDGNTMAFPVRLAPGYDYRVAAWADIVVDNGEKADRCYETTNGLDAIKIFEDKWKPMDETRDAYTGLLRISDFGNASTNYNITLQRPFAKIRVVATDIADIRKVGLEPTTATMSYSDDMYRTFNAVADTKINETDRSDAAERKDVTYTYVQEYYEAYSKDAAEFTLFTDYIFVPALGTAKFTLTVKDQDNRTIKENSFNTEIFVERNKLTTIKGDVLTTGGNVSVKVESGLEEFKTITIVDTAEDLQDKINNATDEETNISLGGNIDLNDLLNAGTLSTRAVQTAGLVIPANKTVVLDLNGYTISHSYTQTGAYALISNYGELTILDSSEDKTGTISYADKGNGGNWSSSTIINNNVLTVNGGNIENKSADAVYNVGYPHAIDNNGILTINDGTFTNNNGTKEYSSMRIWCTTDDNTIVTINGGTFNGSIDFHNPSAAANKGTLTINGGTFNADTYTNCSVRLLGFGADVDEMNGYIKGGHFNSAIILKKYYTTDDVFNSKVFDITGGTFTVDPSEFVNDNYAVVENNRIYSLELKPVIAKIGNTEYRTLQNAVNEAANGDTIVLLESVEQVDGVLITDKNITIDLNDKTFTVTNGANTNNRNFKVNGSSVVTIKNGTMVAEAEYSSGAYGTLRTEGTANVTLNDVKLYNYRGNGLNVKALSGTTVTITDAEVYSQYGGGIESAGGTIELTNVKVEQKGMYTAPYNSMAISVNGGGTVTVNSGTYSTECLTAEDANNQGTSHGPWCAGVLNSGGTLIIKGGTFSNDNFGENSLATAARGLLLADTGANIQINGGEFNALNKIIDIQNNKGDASKNPKATIFGGDFSANPLTWDGLISIADGYKVVENNGRWTVVVDPVAKIGSTEYATFEAAAAAAKAGDTIILNKDVTLSAELMIPAGVTLNGNGKQINGSIYAGGDLTFAGHTKVTAFSASYYDRVITIGEGACLEVTGGGRVSLAYGNTFNITGSIPSDKAKTADKANIQPSLIIPGGISITGGNDAAMNVTNAYVKIGSTTSKPGVANGKFTLNFDNAIVEFTKEFGFYEPTGGVAPEFVMNIKDSVFTTGTKLCIAAANSTVNVDNSVVALGDYLRNSGNLNLINGSVFTGRTIQFGENGGNNGAITVDNSSFTIVAGSTGNAFDGKGFGSITAQNGATVAVDYYKDMTISVDDTSTFTGTEVK